MYQVALTIAAGRETHKTASTRHVAAACCQLFDSYSCTYYNDSY